MAQNGTEWGKKNFRITFEALDWKWFEVRNCNG
jgi:hypothetical protein